MEIVVKWDSNDTSLNYSKVKMEKKIQSEHSTTPEMSNIFHKTSFGFMTTRKYLLNEFNYALELNFI